MELGAKIFLANLPNSSWSKSQFIFVLTNVNFINEGEGIDLH